MIQFLPTELVHKVTTYLSCDDIYSISQIPEFESLFHIITDSDLMKRFYFHNQNKVRCDHLSSFRRYTTSKIYLIEITKPFEFDFSDFNRKFQNASKAVCFINSDPESVHNGRQFDDFQLSLLKKYHNCSLTKFKFINLNRVSIDNLEKLDYPKVSLLQCSDVTIRNCDSVSEEQNYTFNKIKNLRITQCSNTVIGNCNFKEMPFHELSIDFKNNEAQVDDDLDFNMDDEDIDSYPLDINVGSANSVNLTHINLLRNLAIGKAESCKLSFNASSCGYIDEMEALRLEQLRVVINGEFVPEIGTFNIPLTLHKLSITDNFQGVGSTSFEDTMLFPNVLPIILSRLEELELRLETVRLLEDIQHSSLHNISKLALKLKQNVPTRLTKSLNCVNVKRLSIEVAGECQEIPMFPACEQVEVLEIINGLPDTHNLRISEGAMINETYPCLKELIFQHINNDVLISQWFRGNCCSEIVKLRLLNVENIPSLITFNDCELPNLEIIEINGIVNSMTFHELEISLKKSPRLHTIVVKIDELNEEFNLELSIWEDYLNELNLKILNQPSLKNLIISNINSIYLRSNNNLEKIVHGGDLDLQSLDADFLPNLQELVYKNLNYAKPIQSVNYINPRCFKKILKSSLHPLPQFFSI